MDTFDRVSAAVIHDIKNSVSALALLSRNAARSFDDPEFRRDAITTLVRTVERMKRLLGRLSAPIETAPIGTKRVNLAELLNEALVPLASHEHVRLVRDVGKVGEVWGDRDALLRVVENLLTNAVEAIDGEGVITVRLFEDAGSAVITVSDTGCGIAEEFRQRFLFTPFRSTKKGGWGIGLYHTKQVVERHYGEISVESVEGQGTTFSVKLPLQESNVWETAR
jgi:signal transduction histidine kinase